MMVAALVLFQTAALSLGVGSRDKSIAIGSVEDPTNKDEIVEAPGPETEDIAVVGMMDILGVNSSEDRERWQLVEVSSNTCDENDEA